MLKVESKIGKVNRNVNDIYKILSDFNLIEPFIPKNQVEDFAVYENKCSFIVQGQQITLYILDKEENNFIKYGNNGENLVNFLFWVQLKEVEPYLTKFKLTLHLDVPSWMSLMLKSKIEKALNEAVDKISTL